MNSVTVSSVAVAAVALLMPRNAYGFHTTGIARPRHHSVPFTTTALNMAQAPDQLPAEAKRYYARPDRVLDLLTSSPQLLFRLGSGALVDGYQCEQRGYG